MKTTASRASAVSQTRGFGDLLYDKAGARPSLDLDFAGTSSLRDKITGEYLVDHTRASKGTYIDNEGLVKEATINLELLINLNRLEFIMAVFIALADISIPIPFEKFSSFKIDSNIQPDPVPISKIFIILFLQ